jgi:hypothetical protein
MWGLGSWITWLGKGWLGVWTMMLAPQAVVKALAEELAQAGEPGDKDQHPQRHINNHNRQPIQLHRQITNPHTQNLDLRNLVLGRRFQIWSGGWTID